MERLRQLKEGLGQIKQGLINLDTKFAEKAMNDMGGPHKSPMKTLLGGTPSNTLGYDGAETVKDHVIGQAYKIGTIGTNAGYRYGLPAAGVTLAGKGLFDMSYKLGDAAAESSGYRASQAIETAQYGSEADEPEENTLTLQ